MPNFLPMRKPAMQRMKVTTRNNDGSTSAISQPYSEMVKPTGEGIDAGSHTLHEQCSGAELRRLLGFLAPDAVQQHLAADVTQQCQRDPRDQGLKDANSSTMVCTHTQPIMGIAA